jgi:hypothetical protein
MDFKTSRAGGVSIDLRPQAIFSSRSLADANRSSLSLNSAGPVPKKVR